MEYNNEMALSCLEKDEVLKSYSIFWPFSVRSVHRFRLLILFQLCRACGCTTVWLNHSGYTTVIEQMQQVTVKAFIVG